MQRSGKFIEVAGLIVSIWMAATCMLFGAEPVMAAMTEPVRTESGLLSGVPGRDVSITAFKGIPYAAAPIGELRWRAPQPAIAWTGIRKPDQFGASCPQRGNQISGVMDEDCLFLNIWTGATSPKERRAVMVWIHGGGFGGGSGSDPRTNGEGLAKQGVVLVTINYRLGPLGYLATPELSKESGHNASGNYGLLDQIAALKWVKKNITAFGGDPNNVTVFGHSAGGGSTNFLSISPLAKGLYRQALAQSQVRWPRDLEIRYLSSSLRTLDNAQRAGSQYVENLRVHSLQELRALPWQTLLQDVDRMDVDVYTGSTGRPPVFRPVVDGWVVPRNFSQTFAAKAQNRVTYVAGNNLDEGGAAVQTVWAKLRAVRGTGPLPLNGGSPRQIVLLADFQSAARAKFGAMAEEYLQLYPASTDDEAADQNNRAIHDNSLISTYLWAQQWTAQTGKPMYTYFWTHAPPGPDHDIRGAYHGSEMNYVFNSFAETDLPWTDNDRQIGEMMSAYWANYAKRGNPNGPGLPNWPAFDAKSKRVMLLGDSFGPAPIADTAKFDFWQRFFATNEAW